MLAEEKLFRQAVAALGGESTAKEWLTRPNPELYGEPPVLWLSTVYGRQRVSALLSHQIKHP